jgi:Ras-related GTP-binding protein A/B
MFERTTFLVIASSRHAISTSPLTSQGTAQHPSEIPMDPKRYERTSEIMKAFKYSCSRLREDFHSMEIEMDGLTAVLDELTRTTYMMIILHDPSIGRSSCFTPYLIQLEATETEAIKMNIRLARPKFEVLQKLDREGN